MRFTGNGFERGKRPFFYLVENYRRRQTLNTREPRSGIGGIGGRAGLKAGVLGKGPGKNAGCMRRNFSPAAQSATVPAPDGFFGQHLRGSGDGEASFFADCLLQRPIPRCRSFSGSYLDNLIKRSENHKILLKSYIFQKKLLTL
ncbi:MAG: hypothetical protein C6P37_09055 [Caldibacillus debilis]|uniref:Uncharacterized protein n=1 Tax=Caldibacillus debilis TaxID=301148 RepID=A0A3E0K4S0_9BACI|nr:MAG: hypothetical protein C6P37_09055 [Caldibacillus debilis]